MDRDISAIEISHGFFNDERGVRESTPARKQSKLKLVFTRSLSCSSPPFVLIRKSCNLHTLLTSPQPAGLSLVITVCAYGRPLKDFHRVRSPPCSSLWAASADLCSIEYYCRRACCSSMILSLSCQCPPVRQYPYWLRVSHEANPHFDSHLLPSHSYHFLPCSWRPSGLRLYHLRCRSHPIDRTLGSHSTTQV